MTSTDDSYDYNFDQTRQVQRDGHMPIVSLCAVDDHVTDDLDDDDVPVQLAIMTSTMMVMIMMMMMTTTYLSSLLVQVTNLAAKISPLTLCRHFITRPNFPLIMILMNMRVLLTIAIIVIMIIVMDRAQLLGLFQYQVGSCQVKRIR